MAALAALLPAGTLRLSVALAAVGAKAAATADPDAKKPGSVAQRLQTIREDMSGAIDEHKFLKVDPEQRLAWWGNGWHNGWHNGGWGNGGWGNGGWHNWGNGWHNW